jgi:demethylspheroidene O-methyltransferase
LTRWIARRRTRAAFDLCAGFVYSQILVACVRLRLLEILFEGPQSLDALASRLGLTFAAADRLLRAATALRLTTRRRRGRFALGPLGAAMVGNPGIAAMVEHHALLYGDLQDPVALLRGAPKDGALAGYWAYAGTTEPASLPAERIAAYSDLMATSQHFVAREILDAYPLDRHRCLLDVGGGDGAFLAAVAGRAPDLRLVLFDLPSVTDRARARFALAGIADRTVTVGGDFRSDPLPAGADIVSLVRVAHDHDDATVLALLRAVRRALAPGGTLLLAEPMANTPGARPVGDAYFGFYLLAMGQGRPRTPEELTALMVQAGFGRPRRLATRIPLLVSVLAAKSPR